MPRKTITVIPWGTTTVTSIETESPHSEDDEELKIATATATANLLLTATPQVYEPDSACGVCYDQNENAEVGGINADDEVFTFNTKSTVNTISKRLRKKCIHERRPERCKECGGAGICEHGRERYLCKECGGAGI